MAKVRNHSPMTIIRQETKSIEAIAHDLRLLSWSLADYNTEAATNALYDLSLSVIRMRRAVHQLTMDLSPVVIPGIQGAKRRATRRNAPTRRLSKKSSVSLAARRRSKRSR